MNLLRLSFFLILTIMVASCGKDDDAGSSCVQSDWVDTYTGTIDCDGTIEDVTVTITASGSDAIIVKYETSSISADFDPLTPVSCDLDKTDSGGGFTLTVDATLDGDNLTFQDVISSTSGSATCTITATRN